MIQPLFNINPSMLLACTTFDEKWVAITEKTVSDTEINNLVLRFNSENGITLNPACFADESNQTIELWVAGELVGLLAINYEYNRSESTKNQDDDALKYRCYIGIGGVFILDAYRGKGLGLLLAETASSFISKKLLFNTIQVETGANSIEQQITIHADYESPKGEKFVSIFAEGISHDDHANFRTKAGVKETHFLNAGY